MKIRKLLFVTKFEDLCYDALKSLLVLKGSGLNHVVFLNVIQKDAVAMKRGSGYLKKEAVRLKETANIRFIDWAENLFEMGMEVGAYISISSLVPEILTVVDKEAPDLIVIGHSHKGRLRQLYSRSEVMELVRRTQVPIMLFKHLKEDNLVPEKPFERVLFACNFGETALKAQAQILDMAPVIRELHMIHVIRESSLKGPDTHTVQQVRKTVRNKLDERAEQMEKAGIDTRCHVYVGDAAGEIIKAAREYQATLVVLGSSDKARALERWTGSITREVAENSAYPCLLIPGEDSTSS